MVRSCSVLPGQVIPPSSFSGRLAEQHLENDDFFHVVDGDGEAGFTIGGKAAGSVGEGKNPSDPTLTSSGIIGGERFTLKKGQGIHIPAGVWHQWSASPDLVIVVFKIPAAEGRVAYTP